jgi:predicted Co/Zn/Cd cation transporter (cation efflux family)
MPRKSEEARNREQRERQQKLRDRDKKAKRPGRDDVARITLYWLISRAIEKEQFEELDKFRDQIVSLLADQGFDEHASDAVFEDLVEKYKTGGAPFRRKVHLLFPDGGDGDI